MITSKSIAASASAVDPAWNVSKAKFLGTPVNFFSVATQETNPQGIFFKPDGTKMYVLGSTGDDVNEYNLSTAWDVSTALFLQLKSISAQEINPAGLFFKPDGTKMYVVGTAGDDVNEYDLSTAWDISTAVFLQLFSVVAQTAAPRGLFFKPDGTKMYITGEGARAYEYDLSTAWNISTAVFLQNSVELGVLDPHDIFFKSDGTKLYFLMTSGFIREFNLSTAWDISAVTFVVQFSGANQESTTTGLFFKDDGTVMYIVGTASDTIFQYQLSTAWDISTTSYSYPATKYFSVAAQDISPSDIFFKPDGMKMYVLGAAGIDVNEYDLSSAWAVSTATYLQNFSITAQETNPLGLFFKPDGTKMYVVGNVGDNVNEYNLSVAWNISTAVFLQLFSVAADDSNPVSLFFKPDGLKMYVLGDFGNEINEYNLATAWDISTTSYLQTFAVGLQETQPQGLFFKPDGTKMYVTGTSGNDVNEYNLSTPWNITSATFVRLFSFVQQTTNPQGVFFRDTGLQMYIISNFSNAIWEYDLV